MAVTASALGQGATPRSWPTPRIGLAALLLVVSGAIIWASGALRSAELVVTGGVMRLGAGQTVVYKPGHIVFFETNGARTVGLQITASCTAVFLVVPFVVLAAFMILVPRTRTSRVLVAMVVAAMIVFWLNQLRLLIIGWATRQFGVNEGFNWAHILAGSIVSTLSMLIALFLFFWLSLAERARTPREDESEISGGRRRLR